MIIIINKAIRMQQPIQDQISLVSRTFIYLFLNKKNKIFNLL